MFSDAFNNLGVALCQAGDIHEAISSVRQAIRLDPNDHSKYSNLIYTLHFSPDYNDASICDERSRWCVHFAEPLRKCIKPHLNERSSCRRVRIGYVSPDFWDHVVGRNVLPIIELHDHREFEVFLYAIGSRSDVFSQRFREAADVWREISGLPDEVAVDLMRGDQIDILVDLSLHMAGNRLPLFARKPAPVQVTWAGYPGSTGLDTMDYRLTDPFLDPVGASVGLYSEKTVRLPHSFWCYNPITPTPAVNPLPARDAGVVTFGSLNNYCKVNEGVIRLWSQVMSAVKGSRLLLLSGQGTHRQRAVEIFERNGVTGDRIDWFLPAPREEYLAAYHRIDLGLDTFPYNGHTTSLDSFWMGVPVVTLVGSTVVGRAGFSQAMNLGLPELVAWTPNEFIQAATGLATNLPRLIELRSTLRERMQASPLMDAGAFTRDIEVAYRAMWDKWCSTDEPAGTSN